VIGGDDNVGKEGAEETVGDGRGGRVRKIHQIFSSN
jgi:hypothetical protein